MIDPALADPPLPDSARSPSDSIETIPPRAYVFAARAQALLGLAAVALSLGHCAAVLLAWHGGLRLVGWRLALGFSVLIPGALLWASRRALRERGPGWRALVPLLALLAASMWQSVRYEATFPVLFTAAAAWQWGWLLAARLSSRFTGRLTRAAAFALLPLLCTFAVAIVTVALGVSFADVET